MRTQEQHTVPSGSIDEAVSALAGGGVVAIPTDTLYGIAAAALDETAVQRVFDVKERGQRVPLPLFVSDVDDFDKFGSRVPDVARRLADSFWPGKLTIVVERSGRVPDIVTGGLDTVGLRVPDHPVPREIVARLAAPITATSANISGQPPLTSAEKVFRHLGDRIDFVVDGGQLRPSKPSTVIDVTRSPCRILRHGAVTPERIEHVTGIEVAV